MARQLRLEYAGAMYHVTSRGNEQKDIFLDEVDRRYFLSHVSEEVKRHGVVLHLFCLMTNHFHLVIETPEGNLSRFMHGVLTGYSVYFNHRRRRRGHLMQGRYGARVVEGEEYLLKLSRYVHLNPVKVKRMTGCALKEKVEYLRRYGWSSYPSYIGRRTRLKFVTYDPTLAQMEGKKADKAGRYRRYVEEGISTEDGEFQVEMERSARSIGGSDFREWADECYDELLETGRVVEDASFRKSGRKSLPVEEVLREVAGALGVKRDDLLRRTRDSRPRGVAGMMLLKHCGLTQRQVAEVLGLTTGAAVSYQVGKVKKEIEKNTALAEKERNLDARLARKRR